MIVAVADESRLGQGLLGRSADAGITHHRFHSVAVGPVHFFGSQFEHGPDQSVPRVADGKLCGVDTYREATSGIFTEYPPPAGLNAT